MTFDWIDFLERHGIEYVTSGPSVVKGNVAVRCPLCGAADPSHHLGISLSGKGWGCWRDASHRGKSDAQLVRLLIGCSRDEAIAIVGDMPRAVSDIESRVSQLLKPAQFVNEGRKLQLPKEFKKIDESFSARLYVQYLQNRKFSKTRILRMSEDFGLRFCNKAAFSGRIIFPVYVEGELVTWTGRSIFPNATLRYMSLTADKERARELGVLPALGMINQYLLWYDDLFATDSDTIVIVEGPFDALRVRVLGEKFGITSTCFFTSEPSRRQVDLLHEVLPKFPKRYVLLDRGADVKAMRVRRLFSEAFTSIDVTMLRLPKHVKDPGDLTKQEFRSLFGIV